MTENLACRLDKSRVSGNLEKELARQMEAKRITQARGIRAGFPNQVFLRDVSRSAIDQTVDLIGNGSQFRFGEKIFENYVAVLVEVFRGAAACDC